MLSRVSLRARVIGQVLGAERVLGGLAFVSAVIEKPGVCRLARVLSRI